MRKYLSGRYWKRRLALLLAVTMVLTTNVFGMDTMSVYAAEMVEDSVEAADIVGAEDSMQEADTVGTEDSTEAADIVGSGDSEQAVGSEGSGDSEQAAGSVGSGDSEQAVGSEGSGDSTEAAGSVGSGDSEQAAGSEGTGDSTDAGDSAEESGDEDITVDGEAEESADVLEDVEAVAALEEDGADETDVVNYTVVVFDSVADFNDVRANLDLLWERDDNDENKYDEKWQDVTGGLEVFLNGIVAESKEYVYIQPRNPEIQNHTLNIPAGIKGALIDSGYYEDTANEENNGHSFAVPADTLNIAGADTRVYFNYTEIDAGDGNKFTVNFNAENNNSRVVFNGILINAVIECTSETGTIEFVNDSIVNGYKSKTPTVFTFDGELENPEEDVPNVNLCIREAAGLSFEEIMGDTEVSLVFNGYPENPDFLPYFNKEINLQGTDEDGEKYDRYVTLRFWQQDDKPFGLDGSNKWWERLPAEDLQSGTQVAYFAGATRNEKELIRNRVNCHDHTHGYNMHIAYTGKLVMDDEDEELCAYRVLQLDNADVYNAVKENIDPIWEEDGDYSDLWDETDELSEYLGREGMEYVVIQATKTAQELPESESMMPELPANIKGALLVSDWYRDEDSNEDVQVEWQFNELKVKAGTEVYMHGIAINTMDQALNIELADNTSSVVFGECVVKALINCESENGTIEFHGDNIIDGYITSTVTKFSASQPPKEEGDNTGEEEQPQSPDEEEEEEGEPGASLLIREAAGLSFQEITGSVEVSLIFNGYPEGQLELLPYFNGEINLGRVADKNADGGERDRGITIQSWQYDSEPFWLKNTDEDWWGSLPADDLGVGTQMAYFAGITRNEKELISFKVGYYNHTKDNENNNEENNLYIAYTGRLAMSDEDVERCAYRVLKLDTEEELDAAKEDPGVIYGNAYNEAWDDTDMLAEYLAKEDIEYVVIQAREESHELDDLDSKTLEMPANIKGALLLSEWSEWNEDEDEDEPPVPATWELNTIQAEGAKEIYIRDAVVDPLGQGLEIVTTSSDVNVVFAYTEIMGDTKLSGIADVKFLDAAIDGALDLGNDKTTSVSLKGLFLADNLSGYSALEIIGGTTFIVRNHGEVVIENCRFTKVVEGNDNNDESDNGANDDNDGSNDDNDESDNDDPGLSLVYNGYPEDPELLPVFNGNIVYTENAWINFRFVQQTEEEFWNGDWWESTPDAAIPIGSQIATIGVDGAAFESLMERLGYSTNDANQDGVKLVRAYNGALYIQKPNENGNWVVGFILATGDTKTYDGEVFAISGDAVKNNCEYDGTVDLTWTTKDGAELTDAPKDAGEYVLKMSVPEGTEGFEGETSKDIIITPKTVTVSIKANESKAEGYEIVWTGFISGDTYTTQAEVVLGEETTEDGVKYRMVSTKGGDVGANYTIEHADAVKIAVKDYVQDDAKPIINSSSVMFPKNKESYSAVYTGEQIRPAMVVAYKYTDGSKQKTQKLKLNVDYILIYKDNVNVTSEDSPATVTVKGIGGYSGSVTKEFTITPKSIKKVTLSAVADVIYEENLDPDVTVMDGTYELVKGEDYTVELSATGSATADTPAELTVKGIGNYNETSKKKVKFNILKSSTTAESSEIKSMAAEGVTLELKNPNKSYTYNGKAIKPAIVVKDGGTKVPASKYKVIYTNNVNAGTQTAVVKVVGKTKKGKGYYGVSKELKFDIKQKDFSKVSVSSVAAVPKTQKFDGVTMTVKDKKRILTEGVDYTVDYSKIKNSDGTLKSDIVIGQKYEVTLTPLNDGSGANYVPDSKKTVYVKFGQLNLASKTANSYVTIKNVATNEVEVMYNGVLLTKDTDYTVKLKQNKNKSTYTVTVKAVKGSAYKGKKVFKDVPAPTSTEQE